jgi:TrmH family RNA methyltransferase
MLITSRDNKTIKDLLKLHSAKRRKERGEYLVYGKTLCEQARDAQVIITMIFTDENEYQSSDFPQKLLVADRVMQALTENAHVAICAVCQIAPQEFTAGQHVVVLDSLQDPGNLGTILRSAKAFGFSNIFVSENSVDLYNMKVLRAAHGAHFSLCIKTGNLDDYLRQSANSLVTTFVDEKSGFSHDAETVYDIVFGNEGNGIRPSIRSLSRENLKIDIEFESLNVAIAASIILYNSFRKKI